MGLNVIVSVMVVGWLAGPGGPQVASAAETNRVSVDSLSNQADNASFTPQISGNSRFVVFESVATNLVAGDTNDRRDVFVHDRTTGQTTRVSVDSFGNQGNGGSEDAFLSRNGRFVVFQSSATNLIAGDTNGELDCFVHDRTTGQTTRVSVDSFGNQANGRSLDCVISGNGRVVAFTSNATNLAAGDTNGTRDIFVHSRLTGQTTRVSVDSFGNQADSLSEFPSLNYNGRIVAFTSVATNLVAGDTNGQADIFVHRRIIGQTTRVSVDSFGNQADGPSILPSLNHNGRVVAFQSWATNLVAGDTNGTRDIFVHRRIIGQTTRVSVDSFSNQADGASEDVFLSRNGRVVVFESSATNLVPGDTNGERDIFVHNRITGQTTRVSVGSFGNQTGDASEDPGISGNGLFVVFHSYASNLVAGDTNRVADIFVHDRRVSDLKAPTGDDNGGGSSPDRERFFNSSGAQ